MSSGRRGVKGGVGIVCAREWCVTTHTHTQRERERERESERDVHTYIHTHTTRLILEDA